jgi:putative zinc finger/helix-turn-helix YgiT family protein
MKKCQQCSGEMTLSREAYRYAESGLPCVILKDVQIRRCPACGAQEVPLPRVAELHRAIALALVHKPARLLGVEVRYLRKYMGWSGVDFASHMGVSPETVSRWENDKETISSTSDRLLRLIIVRSWPVEDYSVDDLVKIDDRRDPPPLHVELRVRDRRWEPVAA